MYESMADQVFLFGSPITPAVEYIGKLFVPTLVQLQQQQPASGELSRIADSSLTPAPELSQTLGSDSDLTKVVPGLYMDRTSDGKSYNDQSSRASTPPRLRGGGDSITIHFLEPIRMSLVIAWGGYRELSIYVWQTGIQDLYSD